MAFALNFDERLKRRLNKIVREYTWETGWYADPRSKVDVVGFKYNLPRVLVEVELKKDNPVENVVKVWLWATREKNTRRILFLHAFSAHYHLKKNSRHLRFSKGKQPSKIKQYERAVFVGSRMKRDQSIHIDYQQLPIVTTTRKGLEIPYSPRMRRGVIVREGGGAMNRAAERLADSIAKLLRR